MKLSKTSRYAVAFVFVLVILLVALGPLVAMRREGFQDKSSDEQCTKNEECASQRCGKRPGMKMTDPSVCL